MDQRAYLVKLVFCIFLFSKPDLLVAQTEHVMWSSFQLQKEISDKTLINVKPIVRFNEDISAYQNSSVDLFVKRKFNKGWSAQVLNRLWFIPDQTNRYFIWFDLALDSPINKIKLTNRIRYHWALNIKERNDPDYIRWSTKIAYLNKGKIRPYLAIEPWFRLNNENQFQRYRVEPGFTWKISENYIANFQYRIEESINLSPKINTNFIVLNLLIKI